MAKEGMPQRLSEATLLSVTVTVLPSRRGAGRTTGPLVAAVVVLAAALGLAVVPRSGLVARRPSTETAAIAAAFGFPARCLAITVSAGNPDFARADVECGHHRGYINASFHRVAGRWRLVLDEGQLFVPNRLLAPARASTTYPLRCLSLAIALHDPRFASLAFARAICKRRA